MIAWLKRLWRSIWQQPEELPSDPEAKRLVILHQKLNLIASIKREFDDKPML